MATYYTSSSTQIDALSGPYIRDQKFGSYPESPLLNANLMMYLNPASSVGSFSEISTGTSISAPNCMEIPSIAGRNEVMFIPPNGDPMCMQTVNGQLSTATNDTVATSRELQLTSRMVDGEQNLQGLSLSLSTQMPAAAPTPPFQYQYSNPGLSSILSTHLPLQAEHGRRPAANKVEDSSQGEEFRNSNYVPYDIHGDSDNPVKFGVPNSLEFSTNPKGVNYNPYHYEQAGIANTTLKSKYLKAAQQLLDEVVNVREALKQPESGKEQNINNMEEGSNESKGKSIPASDAQESPIGSSQEISPAEQQDLQNKLDKLLSMLDEVDRRYKQYYHQMQILVSSFDMVAGCGAAKPYTALALKTISRHFRCLRDAISNQIQVTRKNLGEQDLSINGQGAIPRLRYVDQQLRQQRALQQFGMIRHAWRPQRGLPESAVSILRAWLFEHFLHPYPKDSEKIMLARQAGLTRGQVANWFINARVRLWKPMVEEMYKEEFGDADINCKSSPENATKATGEKSWGSDDKREEMQESVTSMGADDSLPRQHHDPKSHANHDGEMSMPTGRGSLQTIAHGDDAKSYGFMRLPDDQNSDGSFMIAGAAYQVPELGGFTVDNEVSLALGLRNGTTETNAAAATAEYPYLDPVNQQPNFGNPHLLNDFVA
ncbi:hypothetical protein Ancab_016272 [Ancistrocladus abbreviatus]